MVCYSRLEPRDGEKHQTKCYLAGRVFEPQPQQECRNPSHNKQSPPEPHTYPNLRERFLLLHRRRRACFTGRPRQKPPKLDPKRYRHCQTYHKEDLGPSLPAWGQSWRRRRYQGCRGACRQCHGKASVHTSGLYSVPLGSNDGVSRSSGSSNGSHVSDGIGSGGGCTSRGGIGGLSGGGLGDSLGGSSGGNSNSSCGGGIGGLPDGGLGDRGGGLGRHPRWQRPAKILTRCWKISEQLLLLSLSIALSIAIYSSFCHCLSLLLLLFIALSISIAMYCSFHFHCYVLLLLLLSIALAFTVYRSFCRYVLFLPLLSITLAVAVYRSFHPCILL